MPHFHRPGFAFHYQVIDGLLSHDTVFLHGNLASNLWWEPAIEEWKKRAAHAPRSGRMILAEWRGCGGSSSFEGSFDLPTLAADYNALLEYLSPGKQVNLVGHSTGGLIGLHAMADQPSRYRRALLLDTVAPEGVQFGPEMIDAFKQMSQDKEFCAAVILGTINGGALSDAYRERIVDSAFQVSPKIWAGVPNLLQNPPSLHLDRLNFPILVAHGEHDAVLPLEKSRALAEALPHGKFELLDQRGHCPNVEDPTRFINLADDFFGSI